MKQYTWRNNGVGQARLNTVHSTRSVSSLMGGLSVGP